jgi:hypothetical protein
VEVASRKAADLNREFRNYYGRDRNFKYHSYVLKGDPDKAEALTRLLDQHKIAYGRASKATVRGFHYGTGDRGSMEVDEHTLVVPTDQKKGTLVKVLFEPNARLSDSITYDITAWSLPYAYGMEAVATEGRVALQDSPSRDTAPSAGIQKGAYAHLTDWNSMKDARFLADLIKAGIRVRRSEQAFQQAGKTWEAGTLIITRGDNTHLEDLEGELRNLSEKHGKLLSPARTGLVESGRDFGSGYVGMISGVRVALLSGEPTSTLRFGEVWHFFEKQLHYPLTVLEGEYLDGTDLESYDVLILPGGWGYGSFLNAERKAKLKEWVAAGGRLIAMGGALSHLGGEGGFDIQRKETGESDQTSLPSYSGTRRDRIKEAITGAIFKTRVDPTHPLAFGYGDTYHTLKLGSSAYELPGRGTVVSLGDAPRPVAGFAGSEALKKLPGSLVFGMEAHGQGEVVYMADNPLFRGFWENGKLFFANALFMVE